MADVAYIQQTIDENRSSWVIGVAVGAIVFTAIAVALRCWSRTLTEAGFWWDDYTILISLPFTWALVGLELGWVSAGLGRHIWEPGVQPTKGFKILFATEIVYDTSITLIRLSVILFYQRIFGRQRHFRFAIWITGAILIAWYIAITGLAIFQCTPVQKQWEYTLPGHCQSLYGTFTGITVATIFVDVILLLLPMPMLWKLQIKMTKKIALIANFLIAYSVVVVTIVRLIVILSVPDDAVQDVPWNSTTPSVLFMVEPAVATVSICLPAISFLVTKGFKRLPLSSIRNTWSKISGTSGASRSTSGGHIKLLGPTSKPFPRPASGGTMTEDKTSFVSDIRHDALDEKVHPEHSVNREIQKSQETTVSTEQPSTAMARGGNPERRVPTKSLELERRIRGYYERSKFPVGSRDDNPFEDLESGNSPSRSSPVPVPPKDAFEASHW